MRCHPQVGRGGRYDRAGGGLHVHGCRSDIRYGSRNLLHFRFLRVSIVGNLVRIAGA